MKKYSVRLISGVFFLMFCVSIFNWLINPLDIFSSPEIEGLNTYKLDVGRHTRISKIYQLERIKPEAIFLASSRGGVFSEEYYSPDNARWFNASMPSASTYELLRVLQDAHAVHPLKRIVLGLDEAFTGEVQYNFSENRLLVTADGGNNNGRFAQRLKDVFSGLFSMDALRSSLRTIRNQKHRPGTVDMAKFDAARVVNAGGNRQMFRKMEGSVFFKYRDSKPDCQADVKSKLNDIVGPAKNFRAIVEFAYKNNIELYVYLSPIHARLYETLRIAGQWCMLEKTKREIVYIVDSLSKQYSKPRFPVWDFSGYNSITTEDVPDAGDTNRIMKWYWEDSHYTEKAARLVLQTIFNGEVVREDFGVMLSPANIESHLDYIRQGHDDYARSHSDDVKELLSIYEEINNQGVSD